MIGVLTPYFGNRDPDHEMCMREAEQYALRISIPNIPYIDMARASLVETALEIPEIDIVVFIDHDIIFQPRDVVLLADHCRESDYGVLAAAYCARKPDGKMIVVKPLANRELVFYQPGLYDADMVAMGFTAIKRSVFETLKKDLPYLPCASGRKVTPYFHHIISDKYYGEDWSFCIRVKQAGIKIGIDTEPRVYHRGSYDYALEDAGKSVPNYETLTVDFQTNHGD